MNKLRAGILASTLAVLTALPLGASPAQAQVCERSELPGCIEIDVPSVKDSSAIARDAKGPRGTAAWQLYLKGGIEAGGQRTYVFYFWGVRPTAVSDLASYRLAADYRTWSEVRKKNPPRYTVEEIDPGKGPRFDPDFDLGPPQRAFRVHTNGGPMGVLQVPWSMLTENAHVLICEEGGGSDRAYPRAQKGVMMTPADFADLRERGRDFAITRPFLYR